MDGGTQEAILDGVGYVKTGNSLLVYLIFCSEIYLSHC